MRSLTTLVWWSRMFVHFCADDMSVCYVPVVALSYVICWSLISKKKSWTFILNHLQFLLDSRDSIWYSLFLLHPDMAGQYPPSFQLTKTWKTLSQVEGHLASFCQPWKGTENRKNPFQPQSARHRGGSWVRAGHHAHPCSPLGQGEAQRRQGTDVEDEFSCIPLQLSLAADMFGEQGWAMFRNHSDLKNLKDVSAPSVWESCTWCLSVAAQHRNVGNCIKQTLVPADKVSRRKSSTARTQSQTWGLKFPLLSFLGPSRFNSESKA